MKHLKRFLENTEIKPMSYDDLKDDINGKFVYLVIDQDMHSYEAILGVYDTFEGAMNCNAWSNRGVIPNERGEGDSLFIEKYEINEELQEKF